MEPPLSRRKKRACMGFQADPLLMFDPMGSCSMVQAKKLMWSACNFLGEPIELVVHKHHNYAITLATKALKSLFHNLEVGTTHPFSCVPPT